MRRFGFWLAACALMLGVGVMCAPVASAHARLKTSDPAANAIVAQPLTQVTITFSEETSATKSGGSVMDASGATVSTGFMVDLNDRTKMTIALKSGLGPGVYTVRYNTFTDDDGGMVDDRFTFTVGQGGAAPVAGATTAAPAMISAPIATTAANATVAATRGPSVTLVPAVSTPAAGTASANAATGSGGGVPALVWVIVAAVVVGVIAFSARLVAARR